jgi:hypothetical protein
MSIESHWPLGFGLLLIAGFGSWVFMHSNRSYLLRWVLIPVSLVVAVASAKVYDARLGYAVPAELPPNFVYLGHKVVLDRAHKTGIEVWAQAADSRLYRIPYSRPMEKALQHARDQAKSGLPVVMHKLKGKPGGRPGRAGVLADSRDPLYESNVVLPSDLDPKDANRTPA